MMPEAARPAAGRAVEGIGDRRPRFSCGITRLRYKLFVVTSSGIYRGRALRPVNEALVWTLSAFR